MSYNSIKSVKGAKSAVAVKWALVVVLAHLAVVGGYYVQRTVNVYNKTPVPVRMWCASADDRIGDEMGVWIAPEKALTWNFYAGFNTEFWCNICYRNMSASWTAFLTSMEPPNPTNWLVKPKGVRGEWKDEYEAFYTAPSTTPPPS